VGAPTFPANMKCSLSQPIACQIESPVISGLMAETFSYLEGSTLVIKAKSQHIAEFLQKHKTIIIKAAGELGLPVKNVRLENASKSNALLRLISELELKEVNSF